jgi:hypothetical protein
MAMISLMLTFVGPIFRQVTPFSKEIPVTVPMLEVLT